MNQCDMSYLKSLTVKKVKAVYYTVIKHDVHLRT